MPDARHLYRGRNDFDPSLDLLMLVASLTTSSALSRSYPKSKKRMDPIITEIFEKEGTESASQHCQPV